MLVPWPKSKFGVFCNFCLPMLLAQLNCSEFPPSIESQCQTLRWDEPARALRGSGDLLGLNTCSVWALCSSRRDNASPPLPAVGQWGVFLTLPRCFGARSGRTECPGGAPQLLNPKQGQGDCVQPGSWDKDQPVPG